MPDCPTCDDTFDTENGMKSHHARVHGESIAGVETECTYCGNTTRVQRTRLDGNNFCGEDCYGEYKRDFPLSRDELTELYEEKGWPGGKIASEYNTSEGTVYRRINEWGLERSKPKYAQRDWLLSELLEKEKTVIQIADECGVHHNTIGRHLNRFGVNGRVVMAERRRNRITVKCAWCGEERERTPGHIYESGRVFCDHDCQGKWLAENNTGSDHCQYNSQTHECAWCGEERERQPNEVYASGRVFCDKKCHGKWISENQTGEDAIRYIDGTTPDYGPNWEEQAEKARKRDGYTCQDCGISQANYSRKLPVHHIIPRRDFKDSNGNYDYEQGNQLENLITLCQSCHAGKWEQIPGLRPDTREQPAD